MADRPGRNDSNGLNALRKHDRASERDEGSEAEEPTHFAEGSLARLLSAIDR